MIPPASPNSRTSAFTARSATSLALNLYPLATKSVATQDTTKAEDDEVPELIGIFPLTIAESPFSILYPSLRKTFTADLK